MNKFLERSNELYPQMVEDRRTIHRFAGTGFDIAETSDYVFNRLSDMGLKPRKIAQTGVTAMIGDSGKCFLCRADMDALPFVEDSGLPFACTTGSMHACGHDMHTAMLLGAAKLLKEANDRGELPGRVKLMFQPAEETMSGSIAMIKEGILDNPPVDAAMALHITVGHEAMQTGGIRFNRGVGWGSSDVFRITITGEGGHGAYPFRSIDPIHVGARILLALQELTSSEIPHTASVVATVCKFNAGTAPNVIPDTATLEGSLRSLNQEQRYFAKKRMAELCDSIGKAYRCKVDLEYLSETGPCESNDEMLDLLLPSLKEIARNGFLEPGSPINGSEDFGNIMERVPSVMFWLGAGKPSEGYKYGIHKPKMTVCEDVMPIGAAMHATCAVKWLESNK